MCAPPPICPPPPMCPPPPGSASAGAAAPSINENTHAAIERASAPPGRALIAAGFPSSMVRYLSSRQVGRHRDGPLVYAALDVLPRVEAANRFSVNFGK